MNDTAPRVLWIKEPLAILARGAQGGIVVAGGRIVELVPRGASPHTPVDEVFDASRHVVIAGLINTHHHFFQTLTRAHPQAINRELFAWLNSLYPVWARHMDAHAFRMASRLAMVELMLSGCTTASDHQYLFCPGLENACDIQVEEARRVGLRFVLNRGSMNLSQKDGGLPPDALVQDEETILLDCERVLKRYHDTSDGAFVQVALAPCAPFTVTRRLMTQSLDLARAYDCRLHTHLGETRDENAYCEERFNCRPVDYLEDLGWLDERVWLAHGIHFNGDEIARLGRHGVGICHCPTSNMTLASGQCLTRDLEAAGSPVGLGVDGSASNDNSNLMESVRHALMLNRLTYDAASISHLDVLRWATQGSAKCLGRDDIGAIAPGKQADLAFYTLDALRFSGAGDPLAALVLCGAHRVDRLMIGGEWRVECGQPVGIDLQALRHAHGQAARAFAAVHG